LKKRIAHTSRFVAVSLLCQWQKNHSSLDMMVEKMGLIQLPDPRDRHLVKALLFGVVRNLATLDWIIEQFSKHPLKKIRNEALQGLRLGLLQLFFMDRIHSAAAINETVEAVKQHKQPKWLTGFVNGVLRSANRERETILEKIEGDKLPAYVALNHPLWLVKRWQTRFGKKEAAAMCRANNTQAELCLRVNIAAISVVDFKKQLTESEIEYRSGDVLSEAVWLPEFRGTVVEIPGYQQGWFSVQDETAQVLCYLLGPWEAGKYLDACAGLGGKTIVLHQLAPSGSTISALEPQKKRQGLLRENLARLGIGNVRVFSGTVEEFVDQNPNETVDKILVDAPCSGLGVTGRHPDIRWNRDEKDLQLFHEKQISILNAAAQLCPKGGVIVYATCSTEPEENEEVVSQFLAENPMFSIDKMSGLLPDSAEELLDGEYLRTTPGLQCSDGFFAVRLVKN